MSQEYTPSALRCKCSHGSSKAPQQAPQLRQRDSHSRCLKSCQDWYSSFGFIIIKRRPPIQLGAKVKDYCRADKEGLAGPLRASATQPPCYPHNTRNKRRQAKAQTATRATGRGKGDHKGNEGLSLCVPGFPQVYLYRLVLKYNITIDRRQGVRRKIFGFFFWHKGLKYMKIRQYLPP